VDTKELESLVLQGESEALEFKKSTSQLRRAMETLCGMLNSAGGRVLVGVTPQGRIVDREVSDTTLRELANLQRRFEPPVTIATTRIDIGEGKEVLILEAIPNPEQRPYVFDGRPYQRVGSTTSVMPQQTYRRLLAERADGRLRWETRPADDYDLADEELLHLKRLGLVSSTGHGRGAAWSLVMHESAAYQS